MKKEILEQIRKLGIKEFEKISDLDLLDGSYLNLEVALPSGEKVKLLKDNKKYYANQAEIEGSDKCCGVAADDSFIAVFGMDARAEMLN